MNASDTIFALSSGHVPAGIAIIRISGPLTRFAIETIFGRVPPPRHAQYGAFKGRHGKIDDGLCLYFPDSGSFTGEDSGEFHTHGSPAVVNSMLLELGSLRGLRAAEPGEFTLRAFRNGKLDLTGVEALSDLLVAQTEMQRRLAIGNASGAQRMLYENWRSTLLHIRAELESRLDFSDQDDVSDELDGPPAEVAALAQSMRDHADRLAAGEIVRDGFSVVLIGAPNSGKSSLLNTLAMRDVAIVSDEAGTTRDVLTVALDVGGYKVNVSDTAGLRDDSVGKVERIGIDRAREVAKQADLVLRLRDLSAPVVVDAPIDVSVLEVGTKLDLARAGPGIDVAISCVDGSGIAELLERIEAVIAGRAPRSGEVVPTRERHREHLLRAIERLDESQRAALPEIQAESVRLAASELADIVGLVDTEEMLGEIFSRFCIGK